MEDLKTTNTIDHVLDSWLALLNEYASNHYSHDEQQSRAALVQTLQTMTATDSCKGYSSRIHVMCYIMVGSDRSHTLAAARVMEPSPHEQLASLRTVPSSSAGNSPWQFDASYLDAAPVSSPLKDIHTIPPSLADTNDSTHTTTKRCPLVSQPTWSHVQSILTHLSPNPPTDDDQWTLLCIEFARVWSQLPTSSEADSLIAHGLLAALTGTEEQQRGTVNGVGGNNKGPYSNKMNKMTSAALAALLPIPLQLCDRYALSDQTLGLVLLWELMVQRSTPSLLAALGSWLLPMLHKLFLAIPTSFSDADASNVGSYSTNGAIVVASRVLQAVIVTNQASPVGCHHAHLLLQRVEYKVTGRTEYNQTVSLRIACTLYSSYASESRRVIHISKGYS
jgi:hypothetical protein